MFRCANKLQETRFFCFDLNAFAVLFDIYNKHALEGKMTACCVALTMFLKEHILIANIRKSQNTISTFYVLGFHTMILVCLHW